MYVEGEGIDTLCMCLTNTQYRGMSVDNESLSKKVLIELFKDNY